MIYGSASCFGQEVGGCCVFLNMLTVSLFLAVFVLRYANQQKMELSDQEQHLTKGEGRGLTSHLIIFSFQVFKFKGSHD